MQFLKNSERLVNWVRVVKSDAEIDLMKSATVNFPERECRPPSIQ